MRIRFVALSAFLFAMFVAAMAHANPFPGAIANAAAPALPDVPTLIDPGKLGAWGLFLSLVVIAFTQLLRMPAFGEWTAKMGPVKKRALVVSMGCIIALATGLLKEMPFAEILTLMGATVGQSIGWYELAVRPVVAHGKRAKELDAAPPPVTYPPHPDMQA